jgi:hypothetical protein
MSSQLENLLAPGTGIVIYEYFPTLRSQTSISDLAIHSIILKSVQPANSDIAGISSWSMFRAWLWYHWIWQDCSAPGCTRTTEDLGRNLRYCAGCRWVPYCSRACQKACWRRKDGHHHCTVCALLRFIGTRHNIPQNTKNLRDLMLGVPRLAKEDVLVISAINKQFALES